MVDAQGGSKLREINLKENRTLTKLGVKSRGNKTRLHYTDIIYNLNSVVCVVK